MNNQPHRSKRERGMALILVLVIILVLTVVVAGVVFVTQTQTWTGYNYKTTTQARYAAEAGIQNTMNWLLNTYAAPTNFTAYDLTKYPVQNKNGAPNTIVLSATTGITANYPDATQQTNFHTALKNQSVSGVPNATFSTYATLLRMTAGSGVSWLAGSGSGVPQVWQITSVGNVSGLRPTSVQLQATYENTSTPIFVYGVAGDGTVCGDVTFTGGVMDSWNSANGGTYAATKQASGASIATNGNVTLSGGSTAVDGSISNSSNINVGNCPDGITNNSGAGAYQSLKLLSTPLSYPAPNTPCPATGATTNPPCTPNQNLNVNSNTCWGASPAGCTVNGSGASATVSLAPCATSTCTTGTTGVYGNITSNSNLHLSAGTYNINTLNLNGGSITLDSVPVIINLGGNSATPPAAYAPISSGNTLFASQSSTTINDGGVPANLQIVTACCLSGGAQMANPPVITMNGSSAMYALVYAPNSYVHITGSSQFLGAVVGQKVTSDSSGGFSYDRSLQTSLLKVGNYIPVNYNWVKF